MPLWWEHNRLLYLGARGEDVKRLQLATNDWLGDEMTPTGVFDGLTESRIRTIQQNEGLMDDGRAGPITQSVIFKSNYTFSITPPPVVLQPLNLCWAAAAEAVLKSTWTGWPKLTIKELEDKYKDFLPWRSTFISLAGIEKLLVDHHGSLKQMRGAAARIEKIEEFLYRSGKQILLGDFTRGAGHVRVIYGVRVREGSPELMLMDPLAGYSTVELWRLHDARMRATIFLAAPFEKKIVDVGL